MTPISPGTLLAGRFQLDDLLEETGGARFWRATDLTLMRDVAVHVVDENDPRASALLDAARTSAMAAGHHLLRVLDAAVEDGVAYVVNEWGNGVSLDRMLLEGPLPPRQAAWLVREVAEAIADAHRLGVAHGRLIPENVMVDDSGAVKLIGFVVDGVLHGRADRTMSEHEADVRNVGALLYAALLGRWPGTSGSTVSAAPTDHGRVLSPRQVRAGVPKALDRICDNVLNRSDPTFPIETAHEIKAALADFLGENGDGLPFEKGPDDTGSHRRIDDSPTHRAEDPEATQAGMPAFSDNQGDDATTWVPAVEHTQVVQPTTKTPYVGMGGGSRPVVWGPDAVVDPAPTPGWESDPPGTPWLRLAGLVAAVLALVVGVVFAFNLGRGSDSADDPETPTGSPVGQVLDLATVDDFDPEADPPEEDPEGVGNAHDGDPSTTWVTRTYTQGPDLVIKTGVGLLLDLGSEKQVSEVQLTLVGSPTSVRLLDAGTSVPQSAEGLEEVAANDAAGTDVTLEPAEPVTTRYLVVWLTSLPQVQGGFRGEVAEIVVRS